MHVRRGDRILNFGWGKTTGKPLYKYVPLSQYVKQTRPGDHILLMTDDDNIITKTRLFPQVHWYYIRRPRFRGSEGGWENHFPSGSGEDEVVVILTLQRLVSRCTTWIQSGRSSSFGNYMKLFFTPTTLHSDVSQTLA